MWSSWSCFSHQPCSWCTLHLFERNVRVCFCIPFQYGNEPCFYRGIIKIGQGLYVINTLEGNKWKGWTIDPDAWIYCVILSRFIYMRVAKVYMVQKTELCFSLKACLAYSSCKLLFDKYILYSKASKLNLRSAMTVIRVDRRCFCIHYCYTF